MGNGGNGVREGCSPFLCVCGIHLVSVRMPDLEASIAPGELKRLNASSEKKRCLIVASVKVTVLQCDK